MPMMNTPGCAADSSLEKAMTLAPPRRTDEESAAAELLNNGPSTSATPSVRAFW